MHTTVQSSLTEGQLNAVHISEDEVMEALGQLKKNKCDACGVSSEHLMHASSALAEPLAIFFMHYHHVPWIYATKSL